MTAPVITAEFKEALAAMRPEHCIGLKVAIRTKNMAYEGELLEANGVVLKVRKSPNYPTHTVYWANVIAFSPLLLPKT